MDHYGLPKCFVVIIATQVARFATVYKIVTMAEVVGFELTVPCDTTVFKTAPIDLSGTLPYLEHRTGFEPVVLQFCRLLLWTTQPPMRCLERVRRFELLTFCLASKHSTPELHPLISSKYIVIKRCFKSHRQNNSWFCSIIYSIMRHRNIIQHRFRHYYFFYHFCLICFVTI